MGAHKIAARQIASALKNEHAHIGERSTPDGALRGLYATKAFHPGDFVASFHGKLITKTEHFALHETDRPLFDRVNEYAASTPDGDRIYPPDLDVMGAHLINHSCGPNAKFGRVEQGALLVRATRPIDIDEEITIHYGWIGVKSAVEKKWHPCACQAPFCAGFIELKIEYIDYEDGTGGPYLPPVEVENRFRTDIANDTDENEEALYNYMSHSHDAVAYAQMVAGIDPDAFFDKLRDAALAAVKATRTLTTKPSARRLAEIIHRYNLLPERSRP